ncbi:MAG TPA: type II toxin-antitoxin system VapC family toxin [Pyrinomonadaceae bacterium]|nr:type II toxin-antitoxin system VapC family toxin [Pyrinomonadaceae bacterium]
MNGFGLLNIEIGHAAMVATLPFHHRDPFDRLLIAQAVVEKMSVVSIDTVFDAYPVTRLW